MELFQQYINDDMSSYAQASIDWRTMFNYLQEYRRKAVEQSKPIRKFYHVLFALSYVLIEYERKK
jgi:hypothetical protein